MTSTPRRPRSIPRDAVERLVDKRYDYLVDDRVVARVYYHPTGTIEWENHYDLDGRPHGVEREEYEDGSLKYRASYQHGLQVGWQEQWAHSGRLLIRKRFIQGTGVDLWWSGGLAEERHFVDGLRHGPERWWLSRRAGVWKETWFFEGLEHGIAREWNDEGRIRRGYPQYFVKGVKVSFREYERARREDPMLPQRREGDARPTRPYPQLIDKPIAGKFD